MIRKTPTPAQLGFRMPAEWEPHAATWIAWPHNREDWPGKFAPIPWVYVEIVRLLSRFETVHIVVRDGDDEATGLRPSGCRRRRPGRVKFFKAATDRVWLRDSGPTFVVRMAADQDADDPPGPIGLLEWKFNAWAKYQNYHARSSPPAQAVADGWDCRDGCRGWSRGHVRSGS